MLDFGAWTPHIAIAAFAYLIFVFSSESVNPFKAPRVRTRHRWRLARSLAMIFFLTATIALLLNSYINLSAVDQILAVTILFLVLSLYPAYRYRHAKTDSVRAPSLQQVSPPGSTLSALAPRTDVATAATTPLGLTNPDSEDPETAKVDISASAEHELELQLSESNRNYDLDYLDQTIAEADFRTADLTISETYDIAQPDLSTPFDSSIEDSNEDALDASLEIDKQDSDTSISPQEALPGEDKLDVSDAILQELAIQNEKIERLAQNNHTLVKSRNALVDEMAELKFSLKKSNAIARKSIAQRDHAEKLKNSALTLAAMERKKRRLTELKAKKALLKMKSKLIDLTDQRVD